MDFSHWTLFGISLPRLSYSVVFSAVNHPLVIVISSYSPHPLSPLAAIDFDPPFILGYFESLPSPGSLDASFIRHNCLIDWATTF